MSLIKSVGAGEQSTGFYKHLLDQSIKLNDDDSSYLKRTPASAGNRRTWTWSAWVKHGAMSHGTGQITLFDASASGSDQHGIVFSGQQFYVFGYASGFTYRKMLTALHRDPAAFYNYVVVFDTTDSTASDRIKIYVNGVRQTAFDGTNTDPSLNFDTGFNNAVAHGLGARVYDGANFFDGYIAEINMIDGTALTAASFGETKDGIWIPKDTSGLTFGTNGFHLTFKDDVVSEGFNAVTYTGTGAAHSVSGLGFDPDLLLVKSRSNADPHELIDTVRGATKRLRLNANNAESTASSGDGFASFNADGFTLNSDGGGGQVNGSGRTYVAWAWEAGGAPTADNSAGAGATPTAGSVKINGSNKSDALAGTIAATRISANTSRGFSIVTYTGTGSNGATVAHGLDSAPEMIWIKSRAATSADGNWLVYVKTGSIDETDYLLLNSYAAADDAAGAFNDTAATSTVFSLGTFADLNESGKTYVAYCFHSVSGYLKFGTYSGSGSSGKSVTTGFRPAFLMIKRTDTTGNWEMLDDMRDINNDPVLYANASDAESAAAGRFTFTSTGFTLDDNGGGRNASGGTYIYMAFADTREAAFFKDVSSNGNHFTPVNLDYRDSVPDTPTNNFATLNALDNDSMTLSNGNLTGVSTANAHNGVGCTFGVTGGKWYWEVLSGGTGSNFFFGMGYSSFQFISQYTNDAYNLGDFWAVGTDGTKFGDSAADSVGELSYGSALSSGDILQLAFDLDNGKFYAGKNGTYFASGDPAAGSNPAFTTVPTDKQMQPFYGSSTAPVTHTFNFGQDSSFGGLVATENSNADGNGHGSFAYAPPSGFLALCSQNLPDPAIIDGTENFNTILYTANGSASRAITGVGFSPDWLWVKSRNATYYHGLWDSVRTNKSALYSNATNAEDTSTAGTLGSLDADGFTTPNVSGGGFINIGSTTYVAWNWLAGTAFSNDASATGVGTIDSSGQVNTTAGFSIVSFEGSGSNATIAHGLSSAPEMLIVKNRENASGLWLVYHAGIASDAETDYLHLESNNAAADDNSAWNDTAPTSSVFSVGTSVASNQSGNDHIAYCFHSVEGYSKVGSFAANGSTQFVYLGFRPAFVLWKRTNSSGWNISDNARDPINEVNAVLHPNSSAAESTASQDILFVSNGFVEAGYANDSGQTVIYLAFADQPFKFANAR